MPIALWDKVREFNRRDLFRQGGMLAAAQALGGSVQRAVAAPLEIGANMYRSIGVRPIINARGTFTIITGSQTLPEVKRAMEQASRSFVHMDELMDSRRQAPGRVERRRVGHRHRRMLPPALTHCTAASIAGGNPERMQRLPEPRRTEERSHRSDVLAQRLRPRHPHARRQAHRGEG